MKIIKNSGKVHWCMGKHVICPTCDSEYQIETLMDLKNFKLGDEVKTECPVCETVNTTYKTIKLQIQPDVYPPNRGLCTGSPQIPTPFVIT